MASARVSLIAFAQRERARERARLFTDVVPQAWLASMADDLKWERRSATFWRGATITAFAAGLMVGGWLVIFVVGYAHLLHRCP